MMYGVEDAVQVSFDVIIWALASAEVKRKTKNTKTKDKIGKYALNIEYLEFFMRVLFID